MNHIPTKISKEDFETYISPYLTKAKRGFVSLLPLYLIFNGILYKLYTGCQWKALPTAEFRDEQTGEQLSYQSFYYHFRKWSDDESFEYLFRASIIAIQFDMNVSELNLDGTHTLAKKGGQQVEYQPRKRGKTSNIFPLTDKYGNIIGFLPLLSGNHHDSFDLDNRFKKLLKKLKKTLPTRLSLEGSILNADGAFDTKPFRKTLFNHNIIPNIAENKRNRKEDKKGRKRLFNKEIYDNRYTNERTHAWVDKFRGLLIRFDRKEIYWLSSNLIAFAMVNLRNVIKT